MNRTRQAVIEALADLGAIEQAAPTSVMAAQWASTARVCDRIVRAGLMRVADMNHLHANVGETLRQLEEDGRATSRINGPTDYWQLTGAS